MDDSTGGERTAPARGQGPDRLDSWKKIASYLRRDVSTVQRWERREGMPVHRHLHDKLGSVFAFRAELDRWWEGRRSRLAADGALAAEPATADAAVEAPAPAAPAGRIRWVAAAAAVLAAAALTWLAVASGYFWRSPLADAKFTRMLGFAGTTQAAAMSRDGKVVAFLGTHDGQVDAWVSDLGSGGYRNLTNGAAGELINPSIRALTFAPDPAMVAIWTRRPDGSQPGDVSIVSAPIAGGPLRPYLHEAAEFDWSRDGQRLVYHTTAPGDPLFVRAAAGEAREDRRIYVAPAGVHCHFPLWSADDAFIYFVRGVPPDDWDIWRIRPSGAGLERITSHSARVAYPVVIDNGTLLYLATDQIGAGPYLYAVDVERRRSHRVSAGLESYTSLASSADGTRLVVTLASTRTSLWRLSLTGDRGAAPLPGPTQVTTDGTTPRLGPDTLMYLAWRGDRQGVWALSRGSTREVWSSAGTRISGGPAISPDGRRIVFAAENGGATVLELANADGSNARVLAAGLALRGNPAWAPDGQSVTVAVLRDGTPRLTRISLDGDPPLQLVAEYSIDPVWSPDGRFLLYSGADVGTTFPLRAAAPDGRPYPIPSVQLTRGARRVVFRDPQTLVLLDGEVGHKNLSLLDLRSGSRHVLAELPADITIRDFDVAADGSEIIFDRVQTSSELALIERPH